MKELQEQFTGEGEVRGFEFTQLRKNEKGYIYEVKNDTKTHYEVFQRKENTQYGCVSYPGSKAFGLWAWTITNLESAIEKFENLKLPEKREKVK